jgi:lipopolysaccharide transport system permease protein
MLSLIRNLYRSRTLLMTLAWKNVALRYKQAYLGVFWVLLKPLCLMVIFSIVRSFIGINSGDIPYSVLVFTALMPWMFFQESTSEGVVSVTGNTALIRKVYFPREIFPVIAVGTKIIGLGVNLVMVFLLMAWHDISPGLQALWIPALGLYGSLASLTMAFFGAAMNVYYRDVTQALPVVLSLLMYLSPILYPLHLVKEKLLVQQIAGPFSEWYYRLYSMNPLAGIIDAFQNVLLRNEPPDFASMLPSALLLAVMFPLSYAYFKRAERFFADVI